MEPKIGLWWVEEGRLMADGTFVDWAARNINSISFSYTTEQKISAREVNKAINDLRAQRGNKPRPENY